MRDVDAPHSLIEMNDQKTKPEAVLCLANQKGGVGKTTTAIQLSYNLSRNNRRVLLIDLDAQSNATSIFIEENNTSPDKSVYAVFKDKTPVNEIIHRTRNERLDILPSVFHLAEVETLLAGVVDGFFRLSESLEKCLDYDYIVIDCPPNLGLMTVNAFVASTHLIIPLQTARFSLDGIQGILNTKNTIKKRFNPSLDVSGALLTMFNPRTTISKVIVESIEDYIPLFTTRISKSVAVDEAHLLKKTISEYQPKNKVAIEYEKFTGEVLGVIQKG